MFLLTIKAWAKWYGVSSAADHRISSYAWVNLGIFYLQCIGLVPNLQSRELWEQHDFAPGRYNWAHCVNDLDTCFLPYNLVLERQIWTPPEAWKDTPVSLLLYGFFHFYTKHFPKTLFATSIKEGGISLPKTAFDKVRIQELCIEDPFETYSSHSPHDLGKPATEVGHPAIMQVMEESEAILGAILTGEEDDDEGYFWRLTEASQTSPNSLVNSMHGMNLTDAQLNVLKHPGKSKSPKKKQGAGKGGRKNDSKTTKMQKNDPSTKANGVVNPPPKKESRSMKELPHAHPVGEYRSRHAIDWSDIDGTNGSQGTPLSKESPKAKSDSEDRLNDAGSTKTKSYEADTANIEQEEINDKTSSPSPPNAKKKNRFSFKKNKPRQRKQDKQKPNDKGQEAISTTNAHHSSEEKIRSATEKEQTNTVSNLQDRNRTSRGGRGQDRDQSSRGGRGRGRGRGRGGGRGRGRGSRGKSREVKSSKGGDKAESKQANASASAAKEQAPAEAEW